MSNKSPRWINEIPNPIPTGKKRELTKKEKQEAKKFRKAVKNGKIDEWFSDNKPKNSKET